MAFPEKEAWVGLALPIYLSMLQVKGMGSDELIKGATECTYRLKGPWLLAYNEVSVSHLGKKWWIIY